MSKGPSCTLKQVQGGECEENGKGSGVRPAGGTKPSNHDNGNSRWLALLEEQCFPVCAMPSPAPQKGLHSKCF